MPVMVDTQILIYALRVARKGDPPDVKTLSLSSQHLLVTHPRAHISAISVIEVLRGLKDDEAQTFTGLLRRSEVRAVSAPISIRAHELLSARGKAETLCPKCLNTLKASPCGKCQAQISRQQRINDALIVATAEQAPDVDILYTNDSGVLALANFVSGLKIERLPINANGPLFDRLYQTGEASEGATESPAISAPASLPILPDAGLTRTQLPDEN